ncbi:MAG: hypothetical protein MI922_09925 [Bacteroidales bacterium]|nr:hypothetical protein [Bacteroidales bacterium]
MALDKEKLISDIKQAFNDQKEQDNQDDAVRDLADKISSAIDDYIQPLVTKFNAHVHDGVITSVSGGGEEDPAVGTLGNTGTSKTTV